MPKLKQPNTLEDLAIASLGSYVMRISHNAISDLNSGRTPEINTTVLHEYLHANIPPILSRKLTVHLFSVIRRVLDYYPSLIYNSGLKIEKNIIETILLICMYPKAIILDMSILPRYATKVLSGNIYRFRKLNTLIITSDLSNDSIALLPIGLSSLKSLVIFEMRHLCTDAIINALCSETIERIHVSGSKNVTNASVATLKKFHKITHLSISDTSLTSEGFDCLQRMEEYEKSDDTGKGFTSMAAEGYVQSIQQYEKSDDTGKDFFHLSVGSPTWVIPSHALKNFAIAFPMLKHLEVTNLKGDMEAIGNFTELVELKISMCNFHTSNVEGFLRLRGSNLKSLKLTATDQTDIISIMNHCVNLKELILFKCRIKDTDLEHTETIGKGFQNLEILDIRYRISTVCLEHILYECINIKRLHLTTDNVYEDLITDRFILRLLSRNPMQNLTKFSISYSSLSMISMNALIQQCPLLETLEGLECSDEITGAEIETLRQNIKENNQDLRIN